MADRVDLHNVLLSILESNNVYFQPPPGFQMAYPCIVYQLSDMDTKFADNVPYTIGKRYSVTVIDKDPDTTIPSNVALLPSCIFDRFFVNENLNHYVFVLYF